MRVVGYTRLSQANSHEAESHDEQKTRIEDWAKQAGHVVIATYQETISGENGPEDRPGFLDALDSIEDNSADGIVVSSIDRLARKLTTQEALLATVWNRSGHVFEVGMGEIPKDDPDDPYRTFVRQVLGAAAQLERSLIVKRMANGRRAAIKRGRSIGPAPSFGWYKDPHDPGHLLPDPETYPLVERSVAMLSRGATLAEVGTFLSSATSRRWHPTQVARLRDRYRKYDEIARGV